MDQRVKQAREAIIDQISKNMTLYGVIPTVGRLMGTMYYYEEPMTLDDMRKELGMSKASMSLAVRELLELDMVEKIWKKGDRKDYYIVEEDNYDAFIKLLCHNWRGRLSKYTDSIHKSVEEYQSLASEEDIDEETKLLIEKDLHKLSLAFEYIDWLNRVLDLFESQDIFKYVPKVKSQTKTEETLETLK